MPVIWNADSGAAAEETPWTEVLAANKESVLAVVAMRPVIGIVITQDCDAIRADQITLCEIRGFRDVEGLSKQTSSDKGWVSIITQQAKRNLKWFYLPPDPTIGFSDKMGVDFQVTLS